MLDEDRFWSAVGYVERNPVRAGMAIRAEDYRWSSAGAHAAGRRDELLTPPAPPLVSDWSERLADEDDPAALRAIRSSTGAGRRLGGKGLLERLEVQLGRRVMPRKRVWAASEDGGRNWSEPQPVPMPIPGSAEQTSPLCVARSGAWHACYSPYNTFDPQVKPERNQVVLLTSRDRGRTWRHTAMLRWPDPLSTAAEAWVVELADGRLLGGKEWTVPELKGHSALRRETSYDLMLAEGLR